MVSRLLALRAAGRSEAPDASGGAGYGRHCGAGAGMAMGKGAGGAIARALCRISATAVSSGPQGHRKGAMKQQQSPELELRDSANSGESPPQARHLPRENARWAAAGRTAARPPSRRSARGPLASLPRIAALRRLGLVLASAAIALGGLLPAGSSSAQSPPRVTSIFWGNSPSTGSTFRLGENINVVVQFDREVTSTGNSQLPLTIGTNTRSAWFYAGRATVLAFRYTVQADDVDTDGISIAADALTASAGTIKAALDNMTDAVLTHGAVGPDPTRRVDGSGPPPGVEVSPQSMVVPEGGSATYTMVLRSEPDAEVSVTVTRAPGSDEDLAAAPAELTFTPSSWSTAQVVTVSADEDGDGTNGTATFTHTAASSDAEYNRIEIAGVTATEGDDELVYEIPFFPLASAPNWVGFARIVNYSNTPGEVRIEGVDDDGTRFGPMTLAIGAAASRYFDSNDLVDGDPSKGLDGGLGTDAEGSWRLRLVTGVEIEPLAYIRTEDGFVTAMHGVAIARDGDEDGVAEHYVPFFNPGRNDRQVSSLRLMNDGEDDVEVTIAGVDDDGAPPAGGDVRLTLAAGTVRTITAEMLESGGDGLRGRFREGSGKWRLTVGADGPIKVMSLLESRRAGKLANLSASGLRGVPGDVAGISLPLFIPADSATRQGFARIINHSDTAGTVSITGVDDAGTEFGPVQLSIGAREAVHFDSQDLEGGNPSIGLARGLGDGAGNWRLQLRTSLEIEPLAYIRTGEGFVTPVHEVIRGSEAGYHVAFFNPGRNPRQRSWLRLVNPSDAPVDVTVSGQDDAGQAPSGGQVSLTLAPGAGHSITARQLEEGGDDLNGGFGAGTGKWQLFVSAADPIDVMSLLESPTGDLANLSPKSTSAADSRDAGIEVGPVSGHTAFVGEAAEFTVRLTSAPFSSVTIPVRSSDESEGLPEASELVFDPRNWERPQTVVVRGTNPSAVNAEQDYVIMLGPSESADPLYRGIEIPDVPMRGIALQLAAPDSLHPFIPGIPGQLQPVVRYTGENQLSFSLTTAPEGMEVDVGTGAIRWTPDGADAGESFTVTLSATDGGRFATATFEVSVAAPIPLATDVVDGRLTVTERESNLRGLSIAARRAEAGRAGKAMPLSAANLSDLQLEVIDDAQATSLPDHVTAISDFFVIRRPYAEAVELRFPLRDLPAGSGLGGVRLYWFGEATDVEGPIWTPVFVEMDFEVSGSDLVIVISGEGLEGLYVFGVTRGGLSSREPGASADDFGPVAAFAEAQSTGGVTCSPRTYSASVRAHFPGLPERDYTYQTCTHTNGSRITVSNFGVTANAVRWRGSATIEDLVGWLIDAQGAFDGYNFGYDKDITVAIHEMDGLGYVTTGQSERRRTLHLNEDNSIDVRVMKNTSVHEYFHHAQGHARTRVGTGTLLIDRGAERKWMIEGSARWFEDDLYDNDNSYLQKERSGARILEAGLNAEPNRSDGKTRPYQRFSFLKLLSGRGADSSSVRCPNFGSSFRGLFTVNASSDPSGIRGLSNALTGGSCNFGSHFGANRSSSLSAAMALYQYSTLFFEDNDMMSRLEADEPNSFTFDNTPHKISAGHISGRRILGFRLPSPGRPITSHLPASGARSMWIDARLLGIRVGIPEGEVAEISVNSSPGGVLVSLASQDSDFEGMNTIQGTPHAWFDTRDDDGYVFSEGSRVPKVFVTLVNPSLTTDVDVTVRVGIRDPDAEVEITSHTDGDTVNNRVVSIAGNISPEIRGDADRVVVTANGIDTVAQVSADGTFTADVVVALGDNLVEARAFRGATPISGGAVLNLQGVESSSRGRNALLASRIALVLRWDTPSNDVDLYSTARDGTLWYRNLSQGSGSLDYDDTSGYGPEVISYRATDSSVYVNGTFLVDVHYYSGRAVTNYTLDVVLNETGGDLRRLRQYRSTVPLTESTGGSGHGPEGRATATSRFNRILEIGCNSARICSLARFDSSKLVQRGLSVNAANADGPSSLRTQSAKPETRTDGAPGTAIPPTTYHACREERQTAAEKLGEDVNWSCNADGTKRWH